jgi:hypothetical protein
MESRKPPSESHANGAENEPRTGRFKRLLSGLLSVPLAEVKDAEERERAERKAGGRAKQG